MRLWVYLDEKLKVGEEQDYLNRIETAPEGEYSREGFYEKANKFGTIALLSKLDIPGQEIFEYFKNRIEFDVFKNILKADKSYMRGDKEKGSMDVYDYLSLLYYYKIYQKLLKAKLLKRYSVDDVLLCLRSIRK